MSNYHNVPKPPTPELLEWIRRTKIVLPYQGVILDSKFKLPVGSLHNSGYWIVTCRAGRTKRVIYRSHLIWWGHNGVWPRTEIDHWDRNPLNDVISNLREATREEQAQNQDRILNRTLPVGVYKHDSPASKAGWIYEVRVILQGVRVTLRTFSPERLDEAIALSVRAQEMRRLNPLVTKEEILKD